MKSRTRESFVLAPLDISCGCRACPRVRILLRKNKAPHPAAVPKRNSHVYETKENGTSAHAPRNSSLRAAAKQSRILGVYSGMIHVTLNSASSTVVNFSQGRRIIWAFWSVLAITELMLDK